MKRVCTKCSLQKEKHLFPKRGNICSLCKNEYSKKWRKNNPDKAQCLHYRKSFGITLHEYNEMRVKQENCCAICGIHETLAPRQKLCVDHCHISGKVRQLLCSWCNIAIGNLREDPEIIKKALNYVEKHNDYRKKAYYENLEETKSGTGG